VIERRLNVRIAAIDPGDTTVERVRVDVAREEQRHEQQQRVRADHDDRDRPDRHRSAEGFAQQQEERRGC